MRSKHEAIQLNSMMALGYCLMRWLLGLTPGDLAWLVPNLFLYDSLQHKRTGIYSISKS